MKALPELIGNRRLNEILEGSVALSGLVIQVMDHDGQVFGRSNWEGRCRFTSDDLQGPQGRLLVPMRCVELHCPCFRAQYFSPVNAGDQNLGLVVGCCEEPGPGNRLHVEFLSRVLSEIVTGEVEIASISADIMQKYHELSVLYEVSRSMASSFSEYEICSLILTMAAQALTVSSGAVYLSDPEGGTYRRVAYLGEEGLCGDVDEVTAGVETLLTTVQTEEQGIIDAEEAGRVLFGHADSPTLLVPLAFRSDSSSEARGLGVIALGEKRAELFSREDRRFTTSLAAQGALAIGSCRAVDQLRERDRYRRDMELAQSIQESFFPDEAPSAHEFQVHGLCLPARRVGGDYYDFFERDDGQLVMMVADVSGHHLGSAILMASMRTVLRANALQEQASPARVLDVANRSMFEDFTRASSFVSVFVATFDPRTKVLKYASAGHNRPLLLSPEMEENQHEWLDADGLLIGVLHEVAFAEGECILSPESVVVLYTDGVVEANNDSGEMFGDERLGRLVAAHRGESPGELCNSVVEGVGTFTGGAERQDDATIVVLKVAP